MSECLMKACAKRRSIYNLGRNVSLKDSDLMQKLEDAVKCAPSAFNSQSARIVVLFGENNQQLWKIAENALSKIVPEDKFEPTKQRIASFAAGYATILYFEDENTVSQLQEKFPLYQDNFPKWSEQSSGMLQYVIWALLAENNIGASLQHYNPLIDNDVHRTWNLPQNWKLIAQMPFGSIEAAPDVKTYMPIEERVRAFY